MVSKKFLDIGEKKIKELEKKDNEDLAKAIVKRWNQTLNNENLKEFNKVIETEKRKIKWN